MSYKIRPKSTWRRTAEAELKELNTSWDLTQYITKDRNGWRKLNAALGPNWDEGNYLSNEEQHMESRAH